MMQAPIESENEESEDDQDGDEDDSDEVYLIIRYQQDKMIMVMILETNKTQIMNFEINLLSFKDLINYFNHYFYINSFYIFLLIVII